MARISADIYTTVYLYLWSLCSTYVPFSNSIYCAVCTSGTYAQFGKVPRYLLHDSLLWKLGFRFLSSRPLNIMLWLPSTSYNLKVMKMIHLTVCQMYEYLLNSIYNDLYCFEQGILQCVQNYLACAVVQSILAQGNMISTYTQYSKMIQHFTVYYFTTHKKNYTCSCRSTVK
jgi:hypothetical protein